MQTMLKSIRDRRENEEGFTLIELMVVVLIIAILIAIAIPTFLGAQNKAKDRAAQSSLRNSLTSAKVIYTDSSSYTPATATALAAVEPSLTFCTATVASKCTGTTSIGPKGVSVTNTSADVIVFAARSASGQCFYLRDTATGPGTEFAASPGGQTACDSGSPVVTGGGSTGWNPDGW